MLKQQWQVEEQKVYQERRGIGKGIRNKMENATKNEIVQQRRRRNDRYSPSSLPSFVKHRAQHGLKLPISVVLWLICSHNRSEG